MLKKTRITILLSTILLFVMFPLINVKGDNDTTKVQLDPSTITVQEIGATFMVNVTIANVSRLCAWDFRLYYRNSILTCIDAGEGPFLQSGGNTYWAASINDTYNSTHGLVRFGSTLLGQVPGVNGSGVLAHITFQTQGGGDTQLNFGDTQLYDCQMPPSPIEHEAIGGEVHVGIHNVAVTDVVSSKTVVAQGYCVNITVTAENRGELPETFNLTVYANTTIITPPVNVTLAGGNWTTVLFTWNTASFAKGNYTISAGAEILPGETNTTDNVFVYGIVSVTIQGDVDGDFDVDIYDVVKITNIYDSKMGDPEYRPNSDIDGDGIIDIYDVVRCTTHYGETYP